MGWNLLLRGVAVFLALRKGGGVKVVFFKPRVKISHPLTVLYLYSERQDDTFDRPSVTKF